MREFLRRAFVCFLTFVFMFTAVPARASVLLSDSFNSRPLGSWAQYSSHGPWYVAITGYGKAGIVTDGTHVLMEAPKEAKTLSETHSSLITTKTAFGNADVTLRVKTVRQYPRGGTPPTWDVAWILWHWTDKTHYYYIVLRTNGLAFGKANPSFPHNQKGLFYLPHGPQFPTGRWNTLRVRQVGRTINVWVDGAHLMTYTDNSSPYLKGKLGLCAENARVHFDNVRISST